MIDRIKIVGKIKATINFKNKYYIFISHFDIFALIKNINYYCIKERRTKLFM